MHRGVVVSVVLASKYGFLSPEAASMVVPMISDIPLNTHGVRAMFRGRGVFRRDMMIAASNIM